MGEPQPFDDAVSEMPGSDADRFKALFENSLDAIFSLNREGRFVTANPAGVAMAGYPLNELQLKNFVELVAPEYLADTIESFMANLKGDQRKIETAIFRKDGTRVDVFVTGVPIRVKGEIVGVFGIAEDITERKEKDQMLRDALQDARRTSKIKDDFLAVLSHELRTPLSPLLLTLDELDEDETLSETVRGQISMMRRNVELEARLIDDLLDVSRIRHGKIKLKVGVVDLHDVLKNVEAIVKSEVRQGAISPQFDLNAPHHVVNGDDTRLHQIFWNLVKNAMKFSYADEPVIVRTSNRDGKRIVVTVEDKGIGMSSEALQRVFNPFEQHYGPDRKSYGGLGLGLAIAKAMVELHGGTIQAHSEGLNKGSTFTVELDLVETNSAAL